MDLRWEFKNRDWLQTLGDVEDFLLWVGIDECRFSNDPEWFKTLPVFERLGFRREEIEQVSGRWRAHIWVEKDTPFLHSGSRLVGKRQYDKSDAVLTALLAFWELETHRKANAARDALGVNKSTKGANVPERLVRQHGYFP